MVRRLRTARSSRTVSFLRSGRHGVDVRKLTTAGIAVQLLTLVSGPLAARMLGADGRGTMVLVTVLTSLVAQLAAGGLPTAVARTVASAHAPALDVLGERLRAWLLLCLLPAALAAGLVVLTLRSDPAMPLLAVAGFTVALLTAWQLVLAGMLQGEGSVRHVNALRVTGTAVYVAFVVLVFVLVPTDDPAIVLLGYAGAQLVGLAVGASRLRPRTGREVEKVTVRQISAIARRSFISSVNTMGLGLDHLIVGLVLTETALGLYAVAASVTNLPMILLNGVAAMLLPRMAARDDAAATALLRRWVLMSIGLALAAAVLLEAIIGPAIRLLFGHDFVPGTGCARILVVGWCFFALRRVLAAAAQAQGRELHASVIEAVCAGLLVATVAVGSALWGISGAALGLTVSGAACCALLAGVIRWHPAAQQP